MRTVAHIILPLALVAAVAAPLEAQDDEPVTTCVVSEGGEILWVDAFRTPDGLFVVEDGERVLFAEAYPAAGPLYVRSAGWYVRDEPLMLVDRDEWTDEQDEAMEDLEQAREEIEEGDLDDAAEWLAEASAGLDPTRFEYVRFGEPTAFGTTEDLVFLGTVDGTPVYAPARDVDARVQSRLDRYHQTTTDLEVILMTDRALADVATLGPVYVAVEPGTRCVLQPLRPLRVVRRTQG